MSETVTARALRTQALIFLFLVLGLLVSFIVVPGITFQDLDVQFRWRRSLIGAFTSFRFAVGDRVFNKTLVGKDGWLYYYGDWSMREYQRTDRFGQRDLATFQTNLDRVNASLTSQGRTFLLVIPPNKTSIYPQYMPAEIPVIGSIARTDQFLAYMRSYSSTPILDLRPALLAASPTQQTFYRTDTHWNDLGSYYAYRAIMNALMRNYPGLQPHPLADYSLQVLPATQTDLPRLMGYLPLSEDDPVLEPRFGFTATTETTTLADGYQMRVTTNQRSDLPRLLVFGDSFYGGLEKFLTPDFGLVAELPYYDAAGPSLAYWVQKEEPDIVILECVERDLGDLFPLLQSIQP